MSRRKKITLGALAVLLLLAAGFLVPTIWFKPWSINHFYARVFLQFALRHPMLLSSLRILEPMGLDFHSDDLDDASVEFALAEAEWMERQLKILHSYDKARMSESQRLSTEILKWFMIDVYQGNQYMFHDYPVNQLFGAQSNLPDFMINIHQINDVGDAKNYVTRISKFGVYFDQVLEGLKLREERGVVPPRFVIRHVLDEMSKFVDVSPEQHLLYTHFQEKLTGLDDYDSARDDRLLERLQEQLEQTVYPAYQQLIDYFTYLEPISTTDDGVWKLPDGDAYYNWCLRHYTTTGMGAERIHELGLREVKKIQQEMREILTAEGYDAGDLAATMQRLNEEERFLYPDTDEGRQQILADYQAIIDEIDAGLDPLFDVRPAMGVTVERVPEFKQDTSSGAYYQAPPFDGSKPGIFYSNLRSVKEIPKFSMRTLAYHEAIPGHHFQIAVAQGLTDLPFFRRIIPFTAYTEGWALYAEQVAAEAGFQEDPYDRLGYLTAQLFRAARLVVDTGIHRKRWTREQAIEYMLENTGMPETDVVAEVERYIVMPGQACAYKVGQLQILELRERAMERLGDQFDIREFHNVALTSGAVPLSILGEIVEPWIESKE